MKNFAEINRALAAKKTNIVKKIAFCTLCFVTLSFSLTGCKEWLTAPEPGQVKLEDFFTSKAAALQCINGCYTPLMWEFKRTYSCEWFIGDVVSDDALKGGQNTTDMGAAYDMENWKTTPRNELLHDFYQSNYLGISRCNLALTYIPAMKLDTAFSVKEREEMLGQAYFLRAYYYFRLVRVFGGTPLVTTVLDTNDKWQQPRATAAAIFDQITADLKEAQRRLPKAGQWDSDNKGRATKGAAEAMLLKTYLYMASPYWNSKISGDAADYAKEAKAWGDSVILSGEYSLCPNYADNFTVEGENGQESVFEIQYKEVAWGDYGEGFGYTAGNFTQRLVRSRSATLTDGDAGWGFNHPPQNLYDEFEPGDPRRDVTILNPDPAKMDNPTEEIYLGSPYLNNKYGWYGNKIAHDSRGPLNNKQIRYADVLLMYAEACLIAGDAGTAKTYINRVRSRVGLTGVPTADETALRHERRCELAMEGHRWFDLVRWGGTKAHMDAYAATESAEARSHMGTFREGVHEIFPIPVEEIELNPMEQNFGYN